MDKPLSRAHSHLFTLRLWQADLGSGKTEWRGRLQNVVSSQNYYFRDWPSLIRYLDETLAMPTNDGQTSMNGNRLQEGGQV